MGEIPVAEMLVEGVVSGSLPTDSASVALNLFSFYSNELVQRRGYSEVEQILRSRCNQHRPTEGLRRSGGRRKGTYALKF